MEETKTIEYVIGGLGLLFFIGVGVALGYLWNELRHRMKEDKKNMAGLIYDHVEHAHPSHMYTKEHKDARKDGNNPLSLKNLKQKE